MTRLLAYGLLLSSLVGALVVLLGPPDPGGDPAPDRPISLPSIEEEFQDRPSSQAKQSDATTRTRAVKGSTVRVQTTSSGSPRSEPVPNMAFEILVPASGQQEDSILLEGRTDQTGEARVDVPLGSEVEFGEDRLWRARVTEPGFQQRLAKPTLANEQGVEFKVSLACKPGFTFRGRTVAESGMPISALVWAKHSIGKSGKESLGQQFNTHTWETKGGKFELHVPQQGIYNLIATNNLQGCGALAGVSTSQHEAVDDLEIIVRGSGSLRGRVVSKNGRPTLGLRILVLLDELDKEDHPSDSKQRREEELLSEGLGFYQRQTVTDERGEFHAHGLRLGDSYVIRTGVDFPGPPFFPIRMTEGAVPANGQTLELLYGRSALEVELLDSSGVPLAGERDGWEEMVVNKPGENLSGVLGWPLNPYVIVRLLREEEGASFVRSAHLHEIRISTALTLYQTNPGDRLLVGVVGANFDASFQEVFMGSGFEPVRIQARESPANDRSKLLVSVRGMADSHDLLGSNRVRVEVSEPKFGTALFTAAGHSDSGAIEFRLPPGSYLVAAEGLISASGVHQLLSERAFDRAEERITLEPNATVSVQLELGEPGQLKITLMEASSGVRLESPGPDPLPKSPLRSNPKGQELNARLVLLAEGMEECPVQFQTQRNAIGRLFPLNSSKVSLALPTGDFLLLGELPDGRTARAPVTIFPGAETEATLTFPSIQEGD